MNDGICSKRSLKRPSEGDAELWQSDLNSKFTAELLLIMIGWNRFVPHNAKMDCLSVNSC